MAISHFSMKWKSVGARFPRTTSFSFISRRRDCGACDFRCAGYLRLCKWSSTPKCGRMHPIFAASPLSSRPFQWRRQLRKFWPPTIGNYS